MSWVGNLKIGTKFNLFMSLLLIFLFLTAAFFTYRREKALIQKVAVDNARGIARQIIETRDYISSVVRGEPEHNYNLVPQVVATQVAKRLTQDKSYYVRQVSLRYRNPDNRPDEYESSQLRTFSGTTIKESYNITSIQGKETFRYMFPMYAVKSCLECHGAFEAAPAFVRSRFPRGHYSYDYKVGEIIGAVSVSIPLAELYRQIGVNLQLELAYRGIVFMIIILILAYQIRRLIITPVSTVSATIIRASRTGTYTDRIPKTSNDEIGQLIDSFNNLMEDLEHKTAQQKESESRYRNVLEMAQSAIVTFLPDGKLVIINRMAETLFGLSRNELLGESVYSLMVEGEEIRKGIEQYLRVGAGGNVGSTVIRRVRNVRGRVIEVEMALSVSPAEPYPLFTAILREPTGRK